MNLAEQVLLLGTLEGLTEFLPVSSTGHLIVASELLHFPTEISATFSIFIQLGAILAVVVLYWRRFLSLFAFSDRDGFSGVEGIGKLALACLPAFILGFLLHDFIKEHLFSSATVVAALFVGGVWMILVERRSREATVLRLEEMSYRQAFLVGCFQCLALWPGMSRSASTIIGGMLVGLDRRVAAEFSFLVAVPVMVAAVGYDTLKSFSELSTEAWQYLGAGLAVAFITGALSIKIFIRMLSRWTLQPFGYYRIVISLVLLILLFI